MPITMIYILGQTTPTSFDVSAKDTASYTIEETIPPNWRNGSEFKINVWPNFVKKMFDIFFEG